MRSILLVVGIAALTVPCRTSAAPAWMDTVATDGRRVGCLTQRLVTAPFRASSRDWIIAGGLAAGVVLCATLDRTVQGEIGGMGNGWTRTVNDAGHTFQRTDVFFGTTTAIYLGGLVTDKPEWRRVGTELVSAFVVAVAGTQLVKFTAGRARPDQDDGPWHFVGPTMDDQLHSFWSGDVTKAFVLASVLSAEARHPVVTVLLYGLAATTAMQRLNTDRHWFSDVAAAAVWSTAVGIGTVKLKTKNQK